MKWLWPYSWFLRITSLKAENAALRAEVRKLQEELRGEIFKSFCQSNATMNIIMSAYNSGMHAVGKDVAK